jgi:predicted small secreted protein
MTRKLLALLSVLGFALALGGCYTVEGMGKDVKAGGEKVEKAADKNKTY